MATWLWRQGAARRRHFGPMQHFRQRFPHDPFSVFRGEKVERQPYLIEALAITGGKSPAIRTPQRWPRDSPAKSLRKLPGRRRPATRAATLLLVTQRRSKYSIAEAHRNHSIASPDHCD